MEKYTCEYVLASYLFEGIDDLFGELSESGKVTWGDAHRTMVTAQRILDELYDTEYKDSYKILKSRIQNDNYFDLFVDLEN